MKANTKPCRQLCRSLQLLGWLYAPRAIIPGSARRYRVSEDALQNAILECTVLLIKLVHLLVTDPVFEGKHTGLFSTYSIGAKIKSQS